MARFVTPRERASLIMLLTICAIVLLVGTLLVSGLSPEALPFDHWVREVGEGIQVGIVFFLLGLAIYIEVTSPTASDLLRAAQLLAQENERSRRRAQHIETRRLSFKELSWWVKFCVTTTVVLSGVSFLFGLAHVVGFLGDYQFPQPDGSVHVIYTRWEGAVFFLVGAFLALFMAYVMFNAERKRRVDRWDEALKDFIKEEGIK